MCAVSTIALLAAASRAGISALNFVSELRFVCLNCEPSVIVQAKLYSVRQVREIREAT